MTPLHDGTVADMQFTPYTQFPAVMLTQDPRSVNKKRSRLMDKVLPYAEFWRLS
jgi:hypothetical protein